MNIFEEYVEDTKTLYGKKGYETHGIYNAIAGLYIIHDTIIELHPKSHVMDRRNLRGKLKPVRKLIEAMTSELFERDFSNIQPTLPI